MRQSGKQIGATILEEKAGEKVLKSNLLFSFNNVMNSLYDS